MEKCKIALLIDMDIIVSIEYYYFYFRFDHSIDSSIFIVFC